MTASSQDNSSKSPNRPIGLFDSGFGGLSVMREIVKLLPHEDLIYLGDTANLPYGNKSPATIRDLAQENMRFLLEHGIKLLVVPCHTACSHALLELQEICPVPVIGMIEPGLSLAKKYARVAVLATAGTIESGIYQKQLSCIPIACPLFVPLIEEGFIEHPSTEWIAANYLSHLKGNIDAALLACTHYPLIKAVLQKVLGPNVTLLEPAASVAQEVQKFLALQSLASVKTAQGTRRFFSTDDPEKFRRFAPQFFGAAIERVEKKSTR